MAMQTVRLRRVVTSLSTLHRSFHSPITSAHSPIPHISISDSMSVQPPASFRFQSRPFSTPWYSPWKKDEVPKDENVDPAPSEEIPSKEGSTAAKDLHEILSKEDDDSPGASLSKENDTENFLTREEIHDLLRSLKKDKDKDPKALESRDENGNFIYLTKEEIDDILTTLRNDPEVIKALAEEKEIAKEIEARKKAGKVDDDDDDDDWTFSLENLGKEGAGEDLFKNVKPLSEYDIDSKLSEEGSGFMDIFKKYDMKALMEKAKEQEEKEKEEMKEYEGYNFMRRREEDYYFNFFEEEKPRVPKNEDDIMEIFAGCDLKHWLVTVDFPDDPRPKTEEMIATYERICAEGLGVSIEEAKKRIYACSTTVYDGFQVEMTREETEKFIDIPEVMLILPDSYLDRKNNEYGGDKYENGVITLRPPPFTYKKREKKKKKVDDSKGEKTGDNKMKLVPPPKVGGGASAGKQDANP